MVRQKLVFADSPATMVPSGAIDRPDAAVHTISRDASG